ncbi:YggS family pyridoxal phosphate-dependent enzyme [Coralliovum pocilloporae]|uniref:YggS family pyridoxal phosphate-dependent enzyme n=1 Tax=Coralliovum pocilloporae TaxID=3066369 RepID=UPI003306EC6F
MSDAADRLASVQSRIDKAASDHGKQGDDVTLIAVSKTFDADAISPVLDAGQKVFGENRVQEAAGKWPGLKEQYEGVELHLIGPLQTNKVRDAVALFDVIHSVDRDKLAKALSDEMAKQQRSLAVFVQVNTGAEPQKAGVLPADAAAFVERCRTEHGLDVAGLMCIPPAGDHPGPHFALLRKMAEALDLKGLSMGMSGDFETAVSFGATHVRVGSAIFGARDYPV